MDYCFQLQRWIEKEIWGVLHNARDCFCPVDKFHKINKAPNVITLLALYDYTLDTCGRSSRVLSRCRKYRDTTAGIELRHNCLAATRRPRAAVMLNLISIGARTF